MWLLSKEWRELIASRAAWVMLLAIGPLVGISFISAVRTYAEASGLHGTSAGVGEAFSPLIGVWAPTSSACELAAAFLLPFVAIRVVAGDRQSGALKLELQRPMNAFARMSLKSAVLLVWWVIASLAPFAAVVLWNAYGGTVHAPEMFALTLGHLLNAGRTIALGTAAAAVTDHPATAAIVVLTATVGTWIVSFMAAIHGGAWETVAAVTPTSMVAEFQHGLVRFDLVLIAGTFIGAGLLLAAIWMRIGTRHTRRIYESVGLAAVTVAVIAVVAQVHASWDMSEGRINSFSRAEEEALRNIRRPVRIEAHLAPEDPRRIELEQRTLSKLRRVIPNLKVRYVSATSIGLFEQANPHYGEIRYELGGQTAVNRGTTPEAVLDTIFELAARRPDASDDDPPFRGHPLAAPPTGAAFVFFVLWPAGVLTAAILTRRSFT